MQNNRWIYWVVGLALLLGILFIAMQSNKGKYNWNKTLRLEESEPYDLSLFHKTLKESSGDNYKEIPQKSSIEEYSSKLLNDHSNVYFYIGSRFYLSQKENEIFKTFAEIGGTIFISCTGFPDNLLRSIPGLSDLTVNSTFSDSVSIHFNNMQIIPSDYVFYHLVKNKIKEGTWHHFIQTGNILDDSVQWNRERYAGAARVSSIYNYPDFIRIKYGAGLVYLHCNPVLFSNLYLKTVSGRNYLAQVFKHIPSNKIWFDQSAGLEKFDADMGSTRESILQYIKKYPGLYYAWLILCLGVVLFIIFGGRRIQRAIPVIEKPGNNTLEFVNTIGYFYFKEKNNKYILEKSWNQFVFFVRQRYHLNISLKDETLVEKLVTKAGLEYSDINDILKKREIFRLLTQISTEELNEMEKSLENFYHKIKK